MSEDDLPYFHRMLAALLDCPEDIQMDQLRAQMILDSAGSEAVEMAINGGDAFASALFRLAVGDTREALRNWIARGAAGEA